eukprot:SAG31_NODE_14402_length_808_cov_2.744711_1_plen_60_part_00
MGTPGRGRTPHGVRHMTHDGVPVPSAQWWQCAVGMGWRTVARRNAYETAAIATSTAVYL